MFNPAFHAAILNKPLIDWTIHIMLLTG